MTLDEAIKRAEEVAEEKEKLANAYESFKDYGNPKSSITSGHEKCLRCAKEHRQLAEWLNDYKRLLEQQSCDDCISRQAVNKLLRDIWVKYVPMELDVNLSFVLGAIDEIESVTPARPKSEWIPVSERLPEDGTWAIFTDGSKISIERYKVDIIDHFFPEERWFSFDDATAWMPLPEPYKAESEVQE